MRPRVLLTLAFAVLAVSTGHALRVERLQSVGGLPPHVVGGFEEAIDFEQGPDGTYYVFDRRAHAVFAVDAARTTARRIIDIGQEEGRILEPSGFDVAADGRLVVADAPRGVQRIQVFDAAGTRLAGFSPPGQPAARVVLGNMMLNGTGSVQFAGRNLLLSFPESGALANTFTAAGYPVATFGGLRATGFESERDLHVALNSGLPLADPTGGYYFVFLAGRPTFRKYSADGALVFERHIEGVEFDALLDAQPTRWPRRNVRDREVPFVAPVVRAAAVSPKGELWISLGVPFTYVYDAQGDKIRTVQFSGAGVISPTSLAFGVSGRVLVTPGCYEFDAR